MSAGVACRRERERVPDSGVEVTELGVKDVILPGEIRELVNKVVEAERVAKANQIRRQEETAAHGRPFIFPQSIFKPKPAPDLIRGGDRFALRKRVNQPRFDSIETALWPLAPQVRTTLSARHVKT